jgi:predicted nucleic acid-binding Zn ribbon protein
MVDQGLVLFLDLQSLGGYFYGMEERKTSLTPLREILDGMFKQGGLPFDIENARIWKVWGETVGPAIAAHAKPLWIKKSLLRVSVSDPIWLQELRFQEQEMREKLNRALGKKSVERIEFRLEQ